jgi:hypothetical protein
VPNPNQLLPLCLTTGAVGSQPVLARIPLLIGLAFISIAIGLGTYELADGIRNRGTQDEVTVTGSAKRSIVSDFVIWDASVTSQGDTPQTAARSLTDWAGKIRTFLREAGARDDEVNEQPIQTETVNGRGKLANTVVAFRLTRSFELRSPRVAEISSLIEKSSGLLDQGVPLAAQPPQYVYTRLAELRPQLLAEATRDALGRARAVVGATGGHLGRLRGVDVGVFQVTPPNSTEVSDYGVYDTSTLQKDVTSVVNVTFAIK